MAEPIRSVLLLDYESLQRSLTATVGETRLADNAVVWLSALEAGRLGPEGVRRRIMVKRCYAGPNLRGKQRDALAGAGFDIVEANEAGARTSADLHMAMDTIDALGKTEGYQEFILMSAAAELAPLLTRLKAHKRASIIFADAATPATDIALADAVIKDKDFARVVNAKRDAPVPIQAPASTAITTAKPATVVASNVGSTDRSDIEAFARRIHAATSIPLFSPKTFAELFRHLTEEISANGYHFQSTARNVAERMVASGRSVTRRQVVFIVKGLALKGHVFSTTDTPEKLAEVFREQAHYLITNAGITLDSNQENLLSAWFLSRAPSAAAPTTLPTTAEAPAAAKAKIAETIEREVAKAIIRPPAPEKVRAPANRAASPPKAPPVKVEMPKSAAASKPVPFPAAREEAKAVIAARIAGAARMKPAAALSPLPAKAAPTPPSPPPRPAPQAPVEEEEEEETLPAVAAANEPPARETADALESSILAAIAEAVDVLVEDSDTEEDLEVEAAEPPPVAREPERPAPPPPRPPREPAPRKRTAISNGRRPEMQPPTPPPPPPQAEEEADSNDIGDQIQRIIASYNRNRTDE